MKNNNDDLLDSDSVIQSNNSQFKFSYLRLGHLQNQLDLRKSLEPKIVLQDTLQVCYQLPLLNHIGADYRLNIEGLKLTNISGCWIH